MSNNINPHRAVIVPASAGSGKTFRIAHEYIYDVLRDRYDEEGRPYFDRSFYKRILAVTFTNKATGEMKSRILNEIHILASGQRSAHLEELMKETSLDEATLRKRAKIIRSLILHDYSHFTVLTNDTFFQRILRAFVRELSVDINFSTELDTAPILEKSVDALIDSITENDDLRKWLEDMVQERIEDNRGWNIRNALASLTNELFNESTRDIVKNSADRQTLKRSISSFAATVKRRSEAFKVKGQVALDAISSRGYSHSDFVYSFTKFFEQVAKGSINKVGDRVISHLTDDPKSWFTKGSATPDKIELACILQKMLVEIYEDYIGLSTLENTLRILQRNYRIFAILGDLQEKIDNVCREDNSRLLSETKHTIASFISESDAPFIYEKVGSYFDKFMIDEFQDTSVKEWNNFLPLLRNATSQSTDTSVLIVGDVKQSIYRWRGGDWSILGGEVERALPDSKLMPLENNWRSLPNIVNFNNAFFRKLVNFENEELNSIIDKADKSELITAECKAELYNAINLAYRNMEQVAKLLHTENKGFISITAPAEGVDTKVELLGKNGMPLYIERIREVLEKGFLPRDITILVRKNKEGEIVANELLQYRNLFPEELQFEITTEEALSLASSPAVKLIIAIIRLSINRNDTASLVLYNHLHYHSLSNISLTERDNHFLDSIRTMSPEEAFEHITIEYAEDLKGYTAYLLTLHEHITSFSNGKAEDIVLFEQWWREHGEKESIKVERNDRSIEIMTIHKAKGLENKVIIIPFCSWEMDPKSDIVWTKPAPKRGELSGIGTFPVSLNKDMANSLFANGYYRELVYSAVDALNMLYVSTTRAKEQLHIFIPNIEKRGNRVDLLILNNYASQMQQVENSDYRIFEVGTFDRPEPSRSKEHSSVRDQIIKEHRASLTPLKMQTSLSRYFVDENSELSPRSMGIKLHRIFECASTREDIFAALNEMIISGELSNEEALSLQENITNTLDTTVAGEWFDGSWERLYRERNIIRPHTAAKRPDRVMTRRNEAAIIDYKFGEANSTYKRQIKGYIDELKRMGYTTVKGYIWYVPSGKIVEIES